jgi:ribosomal protein L29
MASPTAVANPELEVVVETQTVHSFKPKETRQQIADYLKRCLQNHGIRHGKFTVDVRQRANGWRSSREGFKADSVDGNHVVCKYQMNGPEYCFVCYLHPVEGWTINGLFHKLRPDTRDRPRRLDITIDKSIIGGSNGAQEAKKLPFKLKNRCPLPGINIPPDVIEEPNEFPYKQCEAAYEKFLEREREKAEQIKLRDSLANQILNLQGELSRVKKKINDIKTAQKDPEFRAKCKQYIANS